jgi:xylan 1,4-beta-xylosidase
MRSEVRTRSLFKEKTAMFSSGSRNKTRILLACLASGTATLLWSQAAAPRPPAPAIGKSLRYCNPLPIEASSRDGSPQGIGLGDVTVVREANKYYLFATGGGAWVSSDLVDWKYQAVEVRGSRIPVAPHVFKYKGVFYLSGNSASLYKASDILGPYELDGPWKNEKGEPWKGVSNGTPWNGAFDVDMFLDDDGKPYLYYPARSTDGIYVAPLKPDDLTQFAAAPKHLFGFQPSHQWERWGEANEYSHEAWIEGPFMFKRNGIYYLEYSGSGTQWLSYATGVYTARSPLGPFTYAPGNPILRKTTGIVTGPGHGSAVQGPDGNWWQFYTIVTSNPPGGRRLGMDPIGFDANGNMSVHATETPQWGPGVVANPARNGDSGSIPLTINKLRNLGQRGKISSERPGHEASYALDNSNGTWWEPAESDTQPSLTIDMGSTTEFAKEQLFMVDSSRILFIAGRGGFGARGGRAAGQPPASPQITGSPAFRYKIESSLDGESFTTILDKTGNHVTKYIEFDELPPTACRFVRLTITDWPHIANSPLGITEFTVFGKPLETPNR